MGSSPIRGTCETCQIVLAGVPSVFSRGSSSPVFAQPTDWPVSYGLKYSLKSVKLNQINK